MKFITIKVGLKIIHLLMIVYFATASKLPVWFVLFSFVLLFYREIKHVGTLMLKDV